MNDHRRSQALSWATRWSLAAVLCAVWSVTAGAQDTAAAKAVVPSAARQAEVRKLLDETFELPKANTAAKKQQAAQKLMEMAGNSATTRDELYVVLVTALPLLREAGDFPTSLAAVEQLIETFQVDAEAERTKHVIDFLTASKSSTTLEPVLNEVVAMVGRASRENRYRAANELLDAADKQAKRISATKLSKSLTEARGTLREREGAFIAQTQAQRTLMGKPDDPKANFAVGLWLAVFESDWEQALPRLALGSDVKWKAAATAEPKSPSEVEAQMSAADAWWEVAQSATGEAKLAAQRRAHEWYERHEPSVKSPLVKARVTKRLEELTKAIKSPDVPVDSIPKQSTAPAKVAGAQDQSIPIKVDLAPTFEKLGLQPHNQGTRYTSSLFAITAVANFEYSRNSQPALSPLSEEFLIWAANESTGAKGDQAMFYEAVHGLNALGICSEKLMPYVNQSISEQSPSDQAIADAKQKSGRWKVQWIKRWNDSRSLSNDEILVIKRVLANGHPVACELRWPKGLTGSSLLNVPSPSDVVERHSIVLSGYEDYPKKKDGGIFLFRNSSGPRWGREGYGVMSFTYVQAYANEALWLQLGTPGSEVPLERVEAEATTVLTRNRCFLFHQVMDDFGGIMWSGKTQLFCRAEAEAFVELGFAVRNAGRYRVRLLGTAAPDFGTIRVALDGKACESDFDLYSKRVCPSGSLELGIHQMAAGRHTLRVTSVGKNSASSNVHFGLDAIDLLATD